MPTPAIDVPTSNNGRVYEACATLQPGESGIVQLAGQGPATVTVHALGGQALVDFSTSPLALIKFGGARWVPAAFGDGGQVADAAMSKDIPSAVNAVRAINNGSAPIYFEVLQ